MTFNSIDIETANEDRSTICQIGIVHVEDGAIQGQWKTLIDPEDNFNPWNIKIHGITENDISGSPTLPQRYDELRDRLNGTVVVSHTAFDRVALVRALAKYKLDPLDVTWLDSSRVARRAWPDNFGTSGWGLKNIANEFGLSFQHHDALEDAKVAARIMLRACEASGLDIDGWLECVERPNIARSKKAASKPISRDGCRDGPLYGEFVVFTGSLALPRHQVSTLAAEAGCNVRTSVSKKTTMLVVGLQDKRRLGGRKKSSKQRRAEQLTSQGAVIQILSEEDFCALVDIRAPTASPSA